MSLLKTTFKQACRDCVNPKLILFTFFPTFVLFLVAALLTWKVLGFSDLEKIPGWISQIEHGQLSMSMLPLVQVAFLLPIILICALLIVSFLMLPMVTRAVEGKIATTLKAEHGGGLVGSCWEGLRGTVSAIIIVVVLTPIWINSNIGGVVASLLMGLPCYRTFAYDAFQKYASKVERKALMKQHFKPMLFMAGVFGTLAAIPGIFMTMALTANNFEAIPVEMVIAVWTYALVYAFTASWYSHYCLSTLKTIRGATSNPTNMPESIQTT